MSLLYDLCQWIQNTNFSVALRESTLAFPVIEGTHLLAIGVSAGTIVLTDLRLLGVLMKKEPASKVMGSLLPFTIAGFILVFITGALLFWAEAAKSYGNLWFRIKLLFLIFAGINALIFHLTAYRRMKDWDLAPVAPVGARIAGLASLVLWTGVIWLGRQFAYNV